MTTQPPIDQTGADFQTDYNQLETDSQAYNTAVAQQQASKEAYNEQYAAIQDEIASGADPEEVLLSLIMLFADEGIDEMDSGLAVDGSAVQIDSDITACNNDIQADIDNGAPLDQVGYESDCMLYAFDSGNDTAGTWTGGLQDAIGTSASSALEGTFGDIRNTMYITDDNYTYTDGTPYNPDENSPTCYFDDSDDPSNTKLTSFDDMQSAMSDPSDPNNANAIAANKVFTDNFTENTNTTGTLNSAAQVEIGWQTKQIQMTLSFTQNMMEELVGTEKQAIQNQTK